MGEEEMHGILLLPEGCISSIISSTSARDACSASAVSRGFKSAAESDTVWERFLPSDYRCIISRSASPVVYPTKKQLFFCLCTSHVLLDGGKMVASIVLTRIPLFPPYSSFALSKWNGKKCYMLSARELSIAWIDNTAYWKWISLPESRFSEVAMLLAVSWLDIQGKMPAPMLSPSTTYAAYLVFKLAELSYGLEFPSKASVRIASQQRSNEAEDGTSSVCLRSRGQRSGPIPLFRYMNRRSHCRFPQNRTDGWMEIELGEFFNDQGVDGEVEMRFMETKLLHWKSGLIIEGIELRPKE